MTDPLVGQHVTYMLTLEDIKQNGTFMRRYYGAYLQRGLASASARVTAVHTPVCVDLRIAILGLEAQALTVKNAMRDVNNSAGTWH